MKCFLLPKKKVHGTRIALRLPGLQQYSQQKICSSRSAMKLMALNPLSEQQSSGALCHQNHIMVSLLRAGQVDVGSKDKKKKTASIAAELAVLSELVSHPPSAMLQGPSPTLLLAPLGSAC